MNWLNEQQIKDVFAEDPTIPWFQQEQRRIGKESGGLRQLGFTLDSKRRLLGSLYGENENPEMALEELNTLMWQLMGLKWRYQTRTEPWAKKISQYSMNELGKIITKDGSSSYLNMIKLNHAKRVQDATIGKVVSQTQVKQLTRTLGDYQKFSAELGNAESLYNKAMGSMGFYGNGNGNGPAAG